MELVAIVEDLAKYGPLVSGVSLAIGAAAAWYTAIRVTQRNAEKDRAQRVEAERRRAADTFQALCSEFWHNEDASYIRRCIVNEKEYPDIAPILAKRNATKYNELSREDNDVIEKIDRFCFLLVRMKSCADSGLLNPAQRGLWKKGREDFWLERMKKRRPDFLEYVRRHWSELGQHMFEIQLQPSSAISVADAHRHPEEAICSPRPFVDLDLSGKGTWRIVLL